MKKLIYTACFLTLIVLSLTLPALCAGTTTLSLPSPYDLVPEVQYPTNGTITPYSGMIRDGETVTDGSNKYLVLAGESGKTEEPYKSVYVNIRFDSPINGVAQGYMGAEVAAKQNTEDQNAVLGSTAWAFDKTGTDKITLKSSVPAVTAAAIGFVGTSYVQFRLDIDRSKLASLKKTDIEVELKLNIPSSIKYTILKDNLNTAQTGPIFESTKTTTLNIKFFDTSMIIDDTLIGNISLNAYNELVSGDSIIPDKTYYVSVDGKKYTAIKAITGTDNNDIPTGKGGFYLGKVLDNKKASAFYISLDPKAGKKGSSPEYVVTCTFVAVHPSSGSGFGSGKQNLAAATYKYQPIEPRPKLDKSVKLGYGYDENSPTINTIGATSAAPRWTLVGGDGFKLSDYAYAMVPASKSAAPSYTQFNDTDTKSVKYLDKMILSENNPKPSSQAYYVRSVATSITEGGANTLILAGIPKKVTPAKQKTGPKLKADYKKEVVKFKAGQMYSIPAANSTDTSDPTALSYTLMTKESEYIKSGVSITDALGTSAQNIYVYTCATAKAPPSAYGKLVTLVRASVPSSNAFDVSKAGQIRLNKGFEIYDDNKNKWGGYKKGTESGTIRVKATKQNASSDGVKFSVYIAKAGDPEEKTKDIYGVNIT